MPHYFFDYQDGDTFLTDEEGSELADDEMARKAATVLLPQVARDSLRDGEHRVFVATVRKSGRLIYRGTLTFHGERLE